MGSTTWFLATSFLATSSLAIPLEAIFFLSISFLRLEPGLRILLRLPSPDPIDFNLLRLFAIRRTFWDSPPGSDRDDDNDDDDDDDDDDDNDDNTGERRDRWLKCFLFIPGELSPLLADTVSRSDD